MCVSCICNEVDITEGIPKQIILLFCRNCERYLQPPEKWVKAELESRELLAVCLKKIKNLSKFNLKDASFIWTEPHSRRLQVKIVVEKEVFGSILLQPIVIEFVPAGFGVNMQSSRHTVILSLRPFRTSSIAI